MRSNAITFSPYKPDRDTYESRILQMCQLEYSSLQQLQLEHPHLLLETHPFLYRASMVTKCWHTMYEQECVFYYELWSSWLVN